MATARNYICRPSYRFLDADLAASMSRDSSPSFELDESDLYNSPRSDSPPAPRDRSAPSSRIGKRPAVARRPDPRPGAVPSSLPVNVPDWSKILREEYRENRPRDSLDNDFFDDDGGGGGGDEEDEGRGGNGRWVPPHELVARTTRMASSFSVTLKGRDLSRVRNAIWAKTGFQD